MRLPSALIIFICLPASAIVTPRPAENIAAPAFDHLGPIINPAAPIFMIAPEAAVPAPVETLHAAAVPETMTIRTPDGRDITVAVARFDGEELALPNAEEADGILLEFGDHAVSVGLSPGKFVGDRADWILLSHDGRVRQLRRRQRPVLREVVGGSGRYVLLLDERRAAELGIDRRTRLPELARGSAPLRDAQRLQEGSLSPEAFAASLAGDPSPVARHYLDDVIANVSSPARREEIQFAVIKHPLCDGHLKMQAATMLFFARLPEFALSVRRWPKTLSQLHGWAQVWIHETGHELATKSFGIPIRDKRVFVHKVGFIIKGQTTPTADKVILLAGGGAEAATGVLFGAIGALLAHAVGWLVMIPFAVAGLYWLLAAPAHAAVDLAAFCRRMGWLRLGGALESIIEEGARTSRPRYGVEVIEPGSFYRAAAVVAGRRVAAAFGKR